MIVEDKHCYVALATSYLITLVLGCNDTYSSGYLPQSSKDYTTPSGIVKKKHLYIQTLRTYWLQV